MKIDLSDLDIVKDLMYLIKRIYQHELTPRALKTYIRFEMGKYLKDYDVKKFLEEK